MIGHDRKCFRYLDNLIQRGEKEIVLDSDITLGYDDRSRYPDGIKIEGNNVVIDGRGHTIDADGQIRIFNVTGKDVTIRNVIFNNGKSSDGGAVFIDNGSVIIQNSVFQNCSSQNNGGGICCEDGILQLFECAFIQNYSKRGGAIYLNKSDCDISKCSLKVNKSYKNGGAIRTVESKLKTYGCSFLYNYSEFGGVMHFFESEVVIGRCNFMNNVSNTHGGAIYKYRGKLDISEANFEGNSAQISGGAIKSEWGKMEITYSSFLKNNASSGGAISDYYGGVVIYNSKLIENEGTTSGGAFNGFFTTLDVSKSELSYNKSESFMDGGGAISVSWSQLRLYDSIFSYNSVNGFGGVIFSAHNNVSEAVDCVFSFNSAESDSVVSSVFDYVNFKDCVFKGNDPEFDLENYIRIHTDH